MDKFEVDNPVTANDWYAFEKKIERVRSRISSSYKLLSSIGYSAELAEFNYRPVELPPQLLEMTSKPNPAYSEERVAVLKSFNTLVEYHEKLANHHMLHQLDLALESSSVPIKIETPIEPFFK
jgi:hypothetical protein